MLNLNLGCGKTKYPNYINIDKEPSVEPDIIADFIGGPLPYEDNSVDRVLFIHTIEHIEEKYHKFILEQIHRVLKEDGEFVIAYPEFVKCASRYIENYRGKKAFWKATIYGRQLYPSDFHVSLMDTREFINVLEEIGFTNIGHAPEPFPEEHNTIIRCLKGQKPASREDIIRNEVLRSL